MGVRMELFPYTAQPAGGESACGVRCKGERRRLSGHGRSRGTKKRGCFFAVRVLAQETRLNTLNNLCGVLLDRVHQARDDLRAVFLPSISSDVGKRIPASVEADRRAGDKGH